MSTPLPNSYPLTSTQHGMLFNSIQTPNSGVDLEQMVATFHHELDVEAFRSAWARVMQEHPVLHSRFTWEGLERPVQEPVPDLPLPFSFQSLEAEAPDDQRRIYAAYLKRDRHDGFDFARGPLFRVALFRIDSSEYRCVFSYAHAIMDGCVSAVVREVFDAYERIRAGQAPVFQQRTPFRDHVLWLDRHLAENASAAADFFRTLLAGFSAHTKLSLERPAHAPAPSEPGYGNHFFALTRETSAAIRDLSKQHALNPAAFVEAAWALLLGAFSGEDDVVFGFTRECRRSSVAGATDTIGLFINTLPVRARLAPDTELLTLLTQLREQQVSIRQHEQTPLVDVLAVAEVPRGTPLFETIIVYNGYHNNTLMQSWGGGFEKREFDFIDQTSFPLSLMVYADDTIHFKLSYDPKRFEEVGARRIAAALVELLAGMVATPHARLGELPRLPAHERRQIVSDWNDTQRPYERACIHEMFEAQVRRTPEHTALAFRDLTLSYSALDARANVLARRLQAAGVGPDVMVGVFVERGFEMMVALLAILKAGGAYVPMDPSYPRDRLAMMLEDARAPVVVTLPRLVAKLPPHNARVLTVDLAELGRAPAHEAERVASGATADNLAYVIFTSGSTGRPKGVMLEHGNVANFFAGMDERVGADKPGVWLALTSISFDISVLELFWTLSRGFTVVVQESLDELAFASAERPATSSKPIDFSLFYFASDSGKAGKAQYRLLIEGAKFADQNEFTAVWTPERHFHSFGGLYPNPSLTSAAIAMVTERIQLRAGSVVLPLHSPIRCAEEWSVVDNLSNGRVGLSFASGWHASDFALAPDNFAKRRDLMWEGIETIRALFRGEAVSARTGDGKDQLVKMYPPSVQKEPRIWITAGGSAETFTLAGKMGASILTNLLVMKPEDLVKNIRAYRDAYAAAGHPGEGHVTLMLHTFVGSDLDEVRERVRGPFMEYLRTSTDLINKARWETTAFAKDKAENKGESKNSLDLGELSPEEMDAMMAHAFERYFKTTGLFGTPSSCLEMIERLKEMGVSEVACLVDFGVDEEAVLASLSQLNELRKLSNAGPTRSPGDFSIPAQMRRYGVTHLQCTPSLAGMLAADPDALTALGSLDKLMLGGEALPTTLLDRLAPVLRGQLLNMYGPTETTIWSTTAAVNASSGKVTLGRPIANTEVYVTTRSLGLCPVGVPGELLIGGAGVARGYLDRPELTAERFVTNPFFHEAGQRSPRLYRTGDLARFLPDGELEFLGRIDHQVKIRGYRIELGEIEALLSRHPSVQECVVVAQPATSDGGDSRLIGYVVARGAQPESTAGGEPAATGAWQAVWNETYLGSGEGKADSDFDIAGWASSYTGELIAATEMKEWVDHTVARILALSPGRLLEIGCGTGMLLYRVAPHVQHYTGLDFSPAALAGISAQLPTRGLRQVELVEKRADQIAELERGAYDTIVLNSVLQYFPDVAYFVRVVQDAIDLLAPGGTFFIGDVRSLPLLEAFHTAVELERSADDASCSELQSRVERRMADERELVLAPALFDALRQQIPAIAEVSVQLKAGAALNELTRFRYDVVLRKRRVDEALPTRTPTQDVASLDALRAAVSSGVDLAQVRDLPNARLLREIKAVQLLRTSFRDATVGDLRSALDELPSGVNPDSVYTLFSDQGRNQVATLWAASGALDRFDVAVGRRGLSQGLGAPSAAVGTPWETFANRPVRVQAGAALPPELRAYLRERLPEFMVPSAFVVLVAFPLTPNGKIDRKALPEPDRIHRASTEAYAAPSNALEAQIAAVWQRLLGLDHIGIRDNFFDLGANSFLMVQASTKLREALGTPISLVDLFQYPSVKLLATRLGDAPTEEAAAQEGVDRAQTRRDAMQKRRESRARAR